MKVLRKGVKPKKYPWVGQYLCPYCNSRIELGEEDAEKVIEWDEGQFDGYSVTVVCPVCEQKRSLMQWEKTTDYHDEQSRYHRLGVGAP